MPNDLDIHPRRRSTDYNGARSLEVELAELRGDIKAIETQVSGQVALFGEKMVSLAEKQTTHEKSCDERWSDIKNFQSKIFKAGTWLAAGMITGLASVVIGLAYIILNKS